MNKPLLPSLLSSKKGNIPYRGTSISTIFSAFLIFFFFITRIAFSQTQSIPAKNHVKEGKNYLESGRYEQAEKEFLEALKIDGTYSDALYLLGLTYLSMKKLDDAKTYLEKVIAHDPKFEVARLYLATVYLKKRDLQKAREQLEIVIKNDPINAQAYYGLGVVSYMNGDPQKSLQLWQKSTDIDKNYAPAYYNMAIANYLLKKPREAKILLEKAIKMKPQNTLYRFSAAWIDYLEGNKEKALSEFDKIKNISGDSAIGLVSDGIQEFERENIPRATECAEKAKCKDPEFYQSLILYGMCMEKMENLEEALMNYEEAFRLDPNDTGIKDRIEKIKTILKSEKEEKKARSNYPYHEENNMLW